MFEGWDGQWHWKAMGNRLHKQISRCDVLMAIEIVAIIISATLQSDANDIIQSILIDIRGIEGSWSAIRQTTSTGRDGSRDMQLGRRPNSTFNLFRRSRGSEEATSVTITTNHVGWTSFWIRFGAVHRFISSHLRDCSGRPLLILLIVVTLEISQITASICKRPSGRGWFKPAETARPISVGACSRNIKPGGVPLFILQSRMLTLTSVIGRDCNKFE